ncbi:glutamine amidotransferase [Massilia sp. IC2-477]|uniref:glutamine amidotransferase n=1 Tax=Massilia sp. IC2-477 TaxID=2887198 RepID=UPI001D0FD85A|nr:glutamine amidotransferase [Massilia sp. IC2-477]MCC2957570.1 glutamine amidotransferase [Massilia sp. IC2-477]
MNKTALVIRHLHFEDLGTLEPLLAQRGYAVRYLDPAVDAMPLAQAAAPELVVVLGGPIGAFDDDAYPFLEGELALVRARLASGRPLLGICLGAQLIARACGAPVYPMGVKEIGFAPLALMPESENSPLALLGDCPVLHWHGDQFDIPPGAVRLAATATCPNQAFALGKQVLGLQFHLEADAARIERWLLGHACELGQAGIAPSALREAAQAAQARLAAGSSAVFSAWLDQAETA